MKNILILLCISLLLVSCNNENDLTDLTTAKEKVKELTGHSDLSELMDEQSVRSVFDVPEAIDIEKKDKEYICSYSWSIGNETIYYYNVSLNFANKNATNDAALHKMWQHLNQTIYKDKEQQTVTNLGKEASWSNLGGGQLRVNGAGYIFYISMTAMKLELGTGNGPQNSMSKEQKIQKAILLAQTILKRLK